MHYLSKTCGIPALGLTTSRRKTERMFTVGRYQKGMKASTHGGMLIDFNNQCFDYSFQFFVRAGHGTLALRRLRQEELKFKASMHYLVSKALPQKY